jgi:hypothetical protein
VGALLLVMLGGDPRGEAGTPPRLPTRVPPELARVIARALRPDRAERPRDGAALLADLRAAELALPGGGRHRARRRRVRLALAVVAAVGAGAGQLWRHYTAPKAPVAVAVADISNETGEEDLDGLAGMLSTSLEQSRVLDVVTRARLVEIAHQRGREVERIDAAVAREAGKAAGVRALLLGALRPDGTGYALRIDAVDPALRGTRHRTPYQRLHRRPPHGARGGARGGARDRTGGETRLIVTFERGLRPLPGARPSA